MTNIKIDGLEISEDKLRELIKAYPELVEKKVKQFEDLGEIAGCYINSFGVIIQVPSSMSDTTNINIFRTENQARSCLAMAQLSQLTPVFLEDNGYKDWKPDWEDSIAKYVVGNSKGNPEVSISVFCVNFLAFPTEDLALKFFKSYRKLIDEYHLIYQ